MEELKPNRYYKGLNSKVIDYIRPWQKDSMVKFKSTIFVDCSFNVFIREILKEIM